MKTLFSFLLIILLASCESITNKEYLAVGSGDIEPTNEAILEYLKTTDYEQWQLFPDSVMLNSPRQMKRLGLPVHGRWVKTFVNDIAYNYIIEAKKGAFSQPLEFPVGSFIIKQNFRSNINPNGSVPISPDSTTIGAITLLYKPNKKHCATAYNGTYNGEDCYGGEWFYGFYFQDAIVGELKPPFSGVQDSIQAHVNSFCINCHAPGYNTDYVRTLDNLVNPYAEESFTSYCDRFDDDNLTSTIPYKAVEPENKKTFADSLQRYINDTTGHNIEPMAIHSTLNQGAYGRDFALGKKNSR